MHAVVFSNGIVEVEERPDPTFRSEELLVDVAAAGLNGADLVQLAGRYPPPDPRIDPSIPGLEFAGTVVEIGSDVTRFSVGDKVMSIIGGAAQAERVAVHERLAIAVPPNVDLRIAGGFCEVFFTAHDALFNQAALSPGDRLLVSGGAGGVGVAAIQLGVHAGAEVTASVRAEAVRERVAQLGATVVDPSSIADHGPFDVILELVGPSDMDKNLQALAPWGRIVVLSTSGGRTADVDFSIVMAKRALLRGSALRTRSFEEKAHIARRVEHHAVPLLASGRIHVPIEAAYPIADAKKAYERFAAGQKFGKILVEPTA